MILNIPTIFVIFYNDINGKSSSSDFSLPNLFLFYGHKYISHQTFL